MSVTKLGSTIQPNLTKEPNKNATSSPKNNDVLDAARMYENHFLREMVKAMRTTVPESEFTAPSMGEKIFREQLDDKYVDDWVDKGGVGLADLIYDQMMDRYFPDRVLKPIGPVKLDMDKVAIQPIRLTPDEMTYKLLAGPQDSDLRSPWEGEVLSSKSLDRGFQSLLLGHPEGLKSSLVFKGSLLVPEGASLSSGQRVGLISPENREVLWKLQR